MRDAPAGASMQTALGNGDFETLSANFEATTQFLVESEAERGVRRHTFLTNAIGELTNAIIERASVNDMFTMVLEALYRSMGFDHVLLLIRDATRKAFVARSGFGKDIVTLKASFEFKLEANEDIFGQAAHKGRNAVIVDTSGGEDVGDREFFEQAPELGIGQMDAVEGLELLSEVGFEAGAVADVRALGVLQATELLDQGRLDVLLSNKKSWGLGGLQIEGLGGHQAFAHFLSECRQYKRAFTFAIYGKNGPITSR